MNQNNLIEAVLFEVTGRKEQSYQLSRSMCREEDVALLNWSQIEKGGETYAALRHMRQLVNGRDICIFGRGPSIQMLESRPQRLHDHHFVPFVINEFKDVTERILAPAGKQPGLVCLTSHDVVRECAADLRELLTSSDFIGFGIPNFLHAGLQSSLDEKSLVDIASSRRRLFLFNAGTEIAFPIPGSPLDLPNVNTLMHTLGLAILLEPRRIFLFGFEGQANEEKGEYYYAEHGKSYMMGEGADWQIRTARWLLWDSFRLNHLAPCFINHLHLLHDVRYPIIFNVCKGSAITCFPTISLDEYTAMVQAEPSECSAMSAVGFGCGCLQLPDYMRKSAS